MFHIIQSNNTDRLVGHLIDFYQKNNAEDDLAHLIFTPFTVIVPSMVLGDWLTKTVASRVGISTLFTAQFWGKYQWDMMKKVLELDAQAHPHDALSVPEVAVLSASIMRWRIFGFVMSEFEKNAQLLDDTAHPLYFLIKPLYDDDTNSLPETRLWQACDELSRLYVRYLTHRPEWLHDWANGVSLTDTVKQMMSEKERLDKAFGVIQPSNDSDDIAGDTANNDKSDDKTNDSDMPEWLIEHYLDLERLLGYLWQQLFGETYRYRLALEERFWQVLSGKRDGTANNANHTNNETLSMRAIQALPKALYLFTVQQIPKVELDFLKQLSLYLDVVLLHFNPSMMFWADIVDRQWLKTQQIIRPHMVYLKDYGHGLLSRLGKESRDTFAMLADLSGGDSHATWQVRWQDDFDESVPDGGTLPNLLQGLKADILMLNHDKDVHEQAGGQVVATLLDDELFAHADDVADDMLMQKVRPKIPLGLDIGADMGSLSIHACHSLKRQLELSRLMIAKYLNDNPERSLADVVVLLPDIVSSEDIIRSVFPDGRGADGLTLPIKITGTPDKSIDELIGAIMGFYTLLGEPTSRFYADEVYEWLLTPALYESFGLSFDEMRRGVELLRQAGFRRGFDERHLSATLHADDSDYRYTFSHALDRLVLGLLNPTKTPSRALHPFVWRARAFGEASLPLMGVSLGDEPVVHALTAIHAGLSTNRQQLTAVDSVERLLNHIEHDVINRYFGHWHDSVAMRAIFNTKNAMMSSLRANRYYHRHLTVGQEQVGSVASADDIRLSMKFVLESLSETVKAQAISAEPSEVITFARFGAVRSIPFGLTVMLDMNLASFPRQDRAVRLDLMRAGVRRLGDRYNEDDDNGAFLDALLCTKDACLIFYQGLSSDGKTKLLPASVVGELIEFLKTEAQWRADGMNDWQTDVETETDDMNDDITMLINQLMPTLVEDYLITYHSPTFFDKAVYYHDDHQITPADDMAGQLKAHLTARLTALKHRQKQALPPPQLWQDIRHTLDSPVATPQPSSLIMDDKAVQELADWLGQSLACPDDKALAHHIKAMCEHYELTLPTHMQAGELIGRFKNLSKTYLHDKVKIDKERTPDEQNEPLSLDSLANYHMNELFIRGAQFGLFDTQTGDESFRQVLDTMSRAGDHRHNDAIFAMQSLYYGDRLPAGQLRLSTPDEYFTQLKDDLGEFGNTLDTLRQDERYAKALGTGGGVLSTTSEQSAPLICDDIHIDITASLPTNDTSDLSNTPDTSWRTILPNTARAEHLFRFFVHHLLWQMTGDDDKFSLWQYRKAGGDTHLSGRTFAIGGIDTRTAKAHILNLIVLAQLAKRELIVMTHRDALAYIARSQTDDVKITPKLFEKWIGYEYSDIYETDSRHETWQLALQGADPYKALTTYLPLALPLYQLMFGSLIAVDKLNEKR